MTLSIEAMIEKATHFSGQGLVKLGLNLVSPTQTVIYETKPQHIIHEDRVVLKGTPIVITINEHTILYISADDHPTSLHIQQFERSQQTLEFDPTPTQDITTPTFQYTQPVQFNDHYKAYVQMVFTFTQQPI